jgi:RES domain-containing protein
VLKGAPLDAAVRTLLSRPLKNLFYRAMLLKFARDPLGKQRPIRRNRFNIDNGARVLYLAENVPTALQEIQAFGFPPHAVVIVPVEVDLQAVVDLRDPAIQSALQLTSHNLAMNFRAISAGGPLAATQELGECAAASGCVDGFLYESRAMPGSVNLAVFENNLAPLKSSLTVNDPANTLHETLP